MNMDNLAEYPLQAFDVRVDMAEDGALLVRNLDAFELDSVGALIWQLCDGKHQLSQIVSTVTNSYDVDEATASNDVLQLIAELRAAGLLE